MLVPTRNPEMPRRARKIPIHDDQLRLFEGYEPPAPPKGWGADEACWQCGRPMCEVTGRGKTHECPPACTRCGRPYYWHGRVSKQYRCWRPTCGCDPYPKDTQAHSWWASLVPSPLRRPERLRPTPPSAGER
jgi:hypothetical protein